jgi:hypothetical protein
MYLDNYGMAKVRMEDRTRHAEHHQLINEARAARRAARPERPSVLAAVRRATVAPLRWAPWKHATVSTTPSVRYV